MVGPEVGGLFPPELPGGGPVQAVSNVVNTEPVSKLVNATSIK